jgi:hypothetical protein
MGGVDAGAGGKDDKKGMKTSWISKTRAAGMVVFSAIVLLFCGACENRNRTTSPTRSEKTMSTATKPKVSPIPPIDALAPAQTATATFALG